MIMSTVVYGLVVSTAEMVSVYPYCRGTVGLADRFVDPALGFAMGWNVWQVSRSCCPPALVPSYAISLDFPRFKVPLGNRDSFPNFRSNGFDQVLAS